MQEKFSKKREKLSEMFELTKEIGLDMPKIVILGESEITIENHKGIEIFKTDEIKIKTKLGDLLIKGSSFEILYIGGATVTISGKFNSVAYER